MNVEKMVSWVILLLAVTNCLFLLVVMGAFVIGLFTPAVDNATIFKYMGPAFQGTATGTLVLLTNLLGKYGPK